MVKKTIDETIEMTVIDPFVVPDHGTEFVVQATEDFPNCCHHSLDQVP